MALPVAFDTETWLIRPGRQAPPMVCLSSAMPATGSRLFHALPEMMPQGPIWSSGKPPEGNENSTSAERHFSWLLEQDPIYGINIAYDMAVCAAKWPHLLWKIFKAYDEDRVIDVALSQRLIDNSKGKMEFFDKLEPNGYSAEGLAKRILHQEIEGKHEIDAWRYRYRELYNVMLHLWPRAAVTYPLGDADIALNVAQWQWLHHRELIGDSPAQARAAFALQLMTCWGIKTDPVKIQQLKTIAEKMYWELSRELIRVPPCYVHEVRGCQEDTCSVEEPLVRGAEHWQTGKKLPPKKQWTRNVRAAQKRMLELTTREKRPLKLTKTGFKKFKKESEGLTGATPFDIFSYDQLLLYTSVDEEACRESGDDTLLQYTKRTQLHGIVKTHVPDLLKGTTTPIQPRYNVFVDSGRTSCSKGKPRKKSKEAARPAAQNGFQIQNPKKALKDFPPGVGIRECFVSREGTYFADNDFSGLESHTGAQACLTIVGYSRMAEALNAGRDLHLQFGAKLLGISYEEAKARKHEPLIRRYRNYAKPANFGLPGGMGVWGLIGYARGLGVKLTYDEAKNIYKEWFEEFPEWLDLFKYVREHIDRVKGIGSIAQLFTKRIRGGVTYTSACNTLFQGLGADGAKHAMYEVAKRCYVREEGSVLYGARPVGFIHDEILAEVFEELAHEQAFEMAKVMVDACNKFLPDVPVRCEPALCKHWTKEVEAVYDAAGRLQPYDLAKEGKWRVFYDKNQNEPVNWEPTKKAA